MLKKKIKWWGHGHRLLRPRHEHVYPLHAARSAEEFTKKHGKTPGEFFGTFEYTHKKSGRKVTADVFPFHNWAFQEGLLHAENLGGDIELMLGNDVSSARSRGATKASKDAPAGLFASLMSTTRSRRSVMPQKPSCAAKPASASSPARCSVASTGSLRAEARASSSAIA
jgi:hypothetical protein